MSATLLQPAAPQPVDALMARLERLIMEADDVEAISLR
jgi:hypothetical protein